MGVGESGCVGREGCVGESDGVGVGQFYVFS